MVRWRAFSLVLTSVAAVALSWSFVGFAQETSHVPAQTATGAVHSAQPQLPDAPIQSTASSSTQSPGITESQSSSASSWSSPSIAATPRFWTSKDPNAQVTVLENTLFRVMTNQPLSTREKRGGARLLFTLSEDVVVDGVLIIPRGAPLHAPV